MIEKETNNNITPDIPRRENELPSDTLPADFATRHKPKHPKQKNYFWLILLLIATFYIGAVWGKNQSPKKPQSSTQVSGFLKNLSNPKDLFSNTETNKPSKIDFDIFWEAWKKIDQKYVDENKLDPEKRIYGAIRGMIGALGDPYSSFMDPDETNDFNTTLEGSFEGIGAELGIKDGLLTVIAPIEGMPAEKAGLRSGDKILKINEETTTDITINEAVKKIKGKKGTAVTLTIVRNGEGKTQDITITRAIIEIKSVVYEKKDQIAYVRITNFAEDTNKEFDRIVATAIADNTKGMIIDVRNNPGGLLNVSVDIASKFIEKGEPIVWERGRDGQDTPYRAVGGNSLSNIPVAIIMNEGSASASEILAGALRDSKGALLIGTKSFGKGSVQQLEALSGGSSMRVTIAKWLTPSKQSIHEVGLEPDIKVAFTEEDFENKKDPQLEKALEEIKKEINN